MVETKSGWIRIVSRQDDVYAGKLWTHLDAEDIAEHEYELGHIDKEEIESIALALWDDMRIENKRIRAIAKESGKKVKR